MYLRSVELLSIFRNFVVAVIISIAGLSVFNSLIKIVKERTREIGALRSIGFFQNQIVLMFGLEACFLALLGNFLGFVATLLVTGVINSTGIMYKAGMLAEPIPFRIAVVPSVYIDSLVFLCCVSILAALVPSFSISRKKIAETLVDV
jgi:putative ABC transport system permease protein